jgi:hypothetical protein
MTDPRAVCRCGRPAKLESVDVTVDGATWHLTCVYCRSSFDVRAWVRPPSHRRPPEAPAQVPSSLDTRNRSTL